MYSIDPLPDRSNFDWPMYVMGVRTPYNVKWYGNDCPGCLRQWELRLRKRGWIDLGPKFGTGRIAPVLRLWTTYGTGRQYLHVLDGCYPSCCPEQLDQYDDEGLLFDPNCNHINPSGIPVIGTDDGKPYDGPMMPWLFEYDPAEDQAVDEWKQTWEDLEEDDDDLWNPGETED